MSGRAFFVLRNRRNATVHRYLLHRRRESCTACRLRSARRCDGSNEREKRRERRPLDTILQLGIVQALKIQSVDRKILHFQR